MKMVLQRKIKLVRSKGKPFNESNIFDNKSNTLYMCVYISYITQQQ